MLDWGRAISLMYSSPQQNFVWSDAKQSVVVWTGVAPTIASLVAAVVVLGLAFVIWRNPTTKNSLHRQSLQMLLWVQVISLVYSATYVGEMLITGPTKWCNAVIILTLWASNFIDFIIMLIPVNLQLALVHNCRTDGYVRYYLLGSLTAATVTALPGAVKNVWGFDPEARICWISITDQRQRNAWEVGAFYVWILFSMVVATISTVIVLLHLWRYTRLRRRTFNTGMSGPVAGPDPSTSTVTSNGRIVRSVAWRITLYPIVLIVCNCVSAAANFSITVQNGIFSYGTYVVWVMSGFCYGVVPLLYALIAIFVDPSFSRALRSLLTGRPVNAWDTTQSNSLELGSAKVQTTTQIQIEFSCQVLTDVGDAPEYTMPQPPIGTIGDRKSKVDAADIEAGISANVGETEESDVEVDDGKAEHGMVNFDDTRDHAQRDNNSGVVPRPPFQRRGTDPKKRLRADIQQL